MDTQKINRLGFYTTRWVRAGSVEAAEDLACRLVFDEFKRTGTMNPLNQPIQVSAEEVAGVSWFEMARRAPGGGFTFYPDDAS